MSHRSAAIAPLLRGFMRSRGRLLGKRVVVEIGVGSRLSCARHQSKFLTLLANSFKELRISYIEKMSTAKP